MRVVVAGAGLAGWQLITKLAADRHDVVAIDLNREVCEQLSAQLGVIAICGNATDIATLGEAEIDRAEVAVALMRQNADNLAFCLLASGAGVKRIIARMPNPKYHAAYRQAGVTSIINVVGLFLDQLLLEIEQPEVHKVATLAAGKGVIIAVRIPAYSHVIGKAIVELTSRRGFPRDCLIVAILRGEQDEIIIPRGSERIHEGDQVFLALTTASVKQAASYFGAKRGLSSLLSSLKGNESKENKVELPSLMEEASEEEE